MFERLKGWARAKVNGEGGDKHLVPMRPAPRLTLSPNVAAASPGPAEPDMLPDDWFSGEASHDLGPAGDRYEELFAKALKRSQTFDLYNGPFVIADTGKRLLNKSSIRRFEQLLRTFVIKNYGGDGKQLAGQCFTTCANLEVDVRGKYAGNPILTLGAVYGDKGRMFGIDLALLERAIRLRKQPPRLDLHAWLTFPTGEIIDPTLLSLVFVHKIDIGIKNGPKELIWGHPKSLAKVRYEPMFIGPELFERLGMFQGFRYTG